MLYQYRHNSPHVVLRAPFDELSGSGFAPNRSSLGSEPQASLGSKRQQFDPPQGGKQMPLTSFGARDDQKALPYKVNKLRRELMADQRRAGKLYWHYRDKAEDAGWSAEEIKALPARGVTMCGWTQIPDTPTLLKRIARGDRYHAFFTGCGKCGLRSVCPVCTAKRAEEDRGMVNDGLAAARKLKLYPVMITLTARHSRDDDPQELIDAISRAEQGMKGVKAWRRLSKRIVGYARVLEWTWSPENGHHPHYHTILLVEAESEKEAIGLAETMRAPYMRQLTAAGRDGESAAAHKHAFQAQGARAAQNYITKWGLAEEMTGAQRKSEGGLTSWQLLRLSRTSKTEKERQQYGAVWWEMMVSIKGRVQLYKSEGWGKLVADWRAEQPEPEPEPDPEEVANFGERSADGEPSPEWMTSRGKTLALREAAESVADLDEARKAVRMAMDHAPTDDEIMDSEEIADNGEVIEDDYSGGNEDVDNFAKVLAESP